MFVVQGELNYFKVKTSYVPHHKKSAELYQGADLHRDVYLLYHLPVVSVPLKIVHGTALCSLLCLNMGVHAYYVRAASFLR